MSGTLFIVATPLGNLSDLSDRAVGTLRAVGMVAAEDTRRTRKLLTHLGTNAALVSLHAHAPDAHRARVLAALVEGRDVALVTDAGTPAISDPGMDLVRAARQAGVSVTPIPGPSAVTTALSVSGLPADRYLFLGFLPRKGAERRRLLQLAAHSPWCTVVYESPVRLAALLRDVAEVTGSEREVVVARELTKLHEEVRTGPVAEVARYYEDGGVKGEVTVVIAPGSREAPAISEDTVTEEAERLLQAGWSRKDVVRSLTESTGWARNEVYRLVMRLSK